MSSPQVIDIEALLAPISEEAPAGTDPRSDTSANSLYYKIKDARNAARAAERAAVEMGGLSPDEWATVVDIAVEILSGHAKDLEVASWLIEGLVRSDGFEGLRDGLKLMSGIVREHWEQCFPELDEDGIEGKVAAVAGLSGAGAVGTLIQPVRLVPLTRGSLNSLSFWNYEQANDLEKITDPARKQQRIDGGAVSKDQFAQSVSETPASEFARVVSAIEECLTALVEMSAGLDAVAGLDAPPVSALRDLLQEIGTAIKHFAADKLAAAAIESAAQEEEAPPEEESAAPGVEGTATVRKVAGYATREEALAELTRIATFFRRTEPHSPISYTLEEAVRRARMSLPDLLVELADDPAQIKRILMTAGIRPMEVMGTGEGA